jgi:uncharacterized protein CbrC (UPF0167 family)
MDPFPAFRYHPDPVETGSVIASAKICGCCARARGYIYSGPVHTEGELDEVLCPWCIADGSAAEKFDAAFTEPDGVGDYGAWDVVSPEIVREVARRTPGFFGWQDERWWTHCSDAAEFLGRAGYQELTERWPGVIGALKVEVAMDDDSWSDYFVALDADSSPTAYVFRCRRCGQLGGYTDCD